MRHRGEMVSQGSCHSRVQGSGRASFMTLNLSPERRVWTGEEPGEGCGQWGQHVQWSCSGEHMGELEEPCGCSPASPGELTLETAEGRLR